MVFIFFKGSDGEVSYFHSVCSLVFPVISVADFPQLSRHFLQDDPCLWVEKTLEDKYPDSLETVEDGEGIGDDEIVERQKEEAGDPAAPQETHEDTHTLHVGDEQVGVAAGPPLVDHHGADGEEKHGHVTDDHHHCRDDEAQHKVVGRSQPAVV